MFPKTLFSLLLCLSMFALTGCPLSPPGKPDPDENCEREGEELTEEEVLELGEVVGDIYDLVNQARVTEGVQPLIYDHAAAEVAYNHSRDMAERGYLAHVNLEGLRPCDRLEEAGIQWSQVGETIHYADGFKTSVIATVVVQEWMHSESHRKILLNGNYIHTGIGVYKTVCGKVYTTQVFFKYK